MEEIAEKDQKKMLFIYNPLAGRAQLKQQLSDVVDIFVKAGYKVTIYPTQAYKDALRVVQAYPDGEYDLVVCGGGDGTIDEVVSGMMKRTRRCPIGYIPAGTVNDFASSIHIPRGILAAADNAVNGKIFPCDVGKFDQETFVYVAAFGIFTDVSYETKQEVKNILGNLAYILEGVTRLFDIPSYKVRVSYGDQVIEDDFIYGMVTNSRSVAGLHNILGNEVRFDDGVFEVTLIKTPKDPVALQEIVAALLIEDASSKYIETFQADKVLFEFPQDVPFTLDGEYGGMHHAVVVEDLNQQLELMVPQSFLDSLKEQEEEQKEEK